MATATKLTAFLNLDAAKFESGLKKAKTNFSNFGATMTKGAKASAAALGVVGAAVVALGVKQASVIDETAKLSAALGVNIREFQALSLAASEAGITQDQLGNAITRSQRAIVEAARGTQTYKRAFDTLGISAKDLINLRPDEQFDRIATALSEIENPTLKTATALEIFGRSGRQVNNMLAGYKENVEAAREFNDKFNVSLTAVDASKVEEANDSFARIGTAISGLGNTISVRFAPLVTAASQALLSAGIDGENFGNFLTKGMDIAASAIDTVRVAILGIRGVFAKVVAVVGDSVAKLSLVVYDLGAQIAETFNRIPGVSLEANKAILDVGLSARKMADAASQSYKDVEAEAGKFVTTSEKLAQVQKDATERAEARQASIKAQAAAMSELSLETEKVAGSTKKLKNEYDKVESSISTFERNSSNAMNGFVSDLVRGEDALSSFKSAIVSVLESLVSNALQSTSSGLLSGLGGLFGSVSNTASMSSRGFGSILSSALSGAAGPGFSSGSQYVPRDMTARVHQGEMILNRREADEMRRGKSSSGGNTYVIDARGAERGVEQKIENVLSQLNAFKKQVPAIAATTVQDLNKRNPKFLST